MVEEFRYSHFAYLGRTKSIKVYYYYSNLGRCKKVKNGVEEFSTPVKCGNHERIYITIAKLFPEICGEWYEGCEIDHIDTNRKNNCAYNLRVCSPKENMQNPLTILHCKQAMKQRLADGVYKETFKKLKGRTAWNKGLKYYYDKTTGERIYKDI